MLNSHRKSTTKTSRGLRRHGLRSRGLRRHGLRRLGVRRGVCRGSHRESHGESLIGGEQISMNFVS